MYIYVYIYVGTYLAVSSEAELITTKQSLSASESSLLTESKSSSDVGVVAELPPRRDYI